MLFYVVLYRHDRNEKARLVVRSTGLAHAETIALAEFDTRWNIENIQRIDNIPYCQEL